jgi:hypothetical protein
MYSIKKIFGVMFLLACVILPQTVSAEKRDWKDNYYNFRGIRRVLLLDLTSDVSLRGNGNIFVNKLYTTYYDNARRLKCEVIRDDQRGRGHSFDPRIYEQMADAVIRCNIKDWSDEYYIIPEHTEWEQKKMYRKVRDMWGNWIEESYYVTVPVTYPPRRVDISKVSVSFEVYDTRTGQMIFGRDDVRDREDRNAQDGMYGRICNSFFQDLSKLIK